MVPLITVGLFVSLIGPMIDFYRWTMSTIWHYHWDRLVDKVSNSDLWVININALRVVDGSIFTLSLGTNPQATIVMLGGWRWHGWLSLSRNDELNLIGFLPTLLQVDTFDSPAQAFTSEDGFPNTRGCILGGSSTIKQIRISMSNPRSITISDLLQNLSFGWCRESRLPMICFPCMSRTAKLGIFPMPE
ncbi:hypothetical protein Cgig2_028259 [Carnegiea gigantea]|uniref:Glucose-methanol-choline oxidoreductase C-terminal domain-containing protein n=1 Tax=Carnegiea gigantea TaxID=171969 RepID=A0A9Q1JKG8_9CARY|nr:hypothetical protein Cgig2_028259 [Carnegiea gigantea]